jgi:urease accessory protein
VDGGVAVVDRIDSEGALPERARDYARDTVTLGWEDRAHVHGRRRTDRGVEFGLSLPRGTVVRGGDCLVLDGARLVVSVIERAEPAFVIEPQGPQQWALFAYHIGNRHQPMMVTDRGLVCPDVPGVEQLLRQLHVPYRRDRLPFTPVGAPAGHHHE